MTTDDLRAAALRLPEAAERAAPRGGHPHFVTNGKCFAELLEGDAATARVWSNSGWLVVELDSADSADVDAKLLAAWRQRAKNMTVLALDYAKGGEELSDVFAELRSWPELTERGVGDFSAGGRAFLHFHHYETGRHADVKAGLGWGDPIPFPLGRPPQDVATAFFEEVRRRLAITLEAIAAKKRR